MENSERETMVEQKKNEECSIAEEPIIYRGWKAMPFVIGNETFEKLGAIGTLSNLLVYLTTVFNMSSITAATIINVFNGTTNFSTLIGAFVSDTYWGRFKTIACASIASLMGLVLIDFTAVFKNPPSSPLRSTRPQRV
ncbi:hypothetical protein M0R45_001959 [Rubus argutus]|uniref:Uncharacterized protein n=1 Tax=Rubus argutus TaxID=59490 RepID=A0AAW1VKC7_RUBAR